MTHKPLNSQAMQPTRKPHIRTKSDLQKNNTSNHSTVQKPSKLLLDDKVKQDILSLSNDSPFRQNILRTNSHQLASSFSFSQDQEQYQYQKLLFAKFLSSKPQQSIAYMHDMNKIEPVRLLQTVKIGQNEVDVNKNKILAHYISVWILSMGYSDPQNKIRVIMNVKYLFPSEQQRVSQIAQIIYSSLFQGLLPDHLQLKLMIQICKRGWEYLSFSIGKYIRALKYFKDNQEQFMLELHNILE